MTDAQFDAEIRRQHSEGRWAKVNQMEDELFATKFGTALFYRRLHDLINWAERCAELDRLDGLIL